MVVIVVINYTSFFHSLLTKGKEIPHRSHNAAELRLDKPEATVPSALSPQTPTTPKPKRPES